MWLLSELFEALSFFCTCRRPFKMCLAPGGTTHAAPPCMTAQAVELVVEVAQQVAARWAVHAPAPCQSCWASASSGPAPPQLTTVMAVMSRCV